MKPKIEMALETVTPELAYKYLDTMTVNRHVSQAKVQQYARDMVADNWLINGSVLCFNAVGELIDGQHRLWACI